MAYTDDQSTDVGTVRTLINDSTEESSPVKGTDYEFDDDEIETIIDQNSGDLWGAAADLCRSLAAKYSAGSINLTLGKGDIKIDNTSRAKGYLMLAKTYDARSGSDVAEYMDSVAYGVDSLGRIGTEYVGD